MCTGGSRVLVAGIYALISLLLYAKVSAQTTECTLFIVLVHLLLIQNALQI